MRIAILKGRSQYGGTRLFADQAAEAFRAAGHETDVLDLVAIEDTRGAIIAHAAAGADLVFTICILGEYRDAEGRTLADTYGAPHVLWQTDYVVSQINRLAAMPRDIRMLMVDPTQIDALGAMFGPDHFHNLGFFPHPAVGPPGPDDASVEAFEANRPIPLLWSGTFQKPDTQWPHVPTNLHKPMHEAVDLALSVEWMPPHEALRMVMGSRGLDLSNPELRGAVLVAAHVDEAVRKTRRLEFLKAVAKTDIPIHICGLGWESQLYRFKNATYHGAVEMTEMVQLMRQSRVVLNTNGNFGAGSHERPFSASLAGAAVFTDHSRYYDEAFAPGELTTYRWRDLRGGMAALKALVADPRRAFETAQAAKARTLAEHTWDRRIGRIFAAAGLTP